MIYAIIFLYFLSSTFAKEVLAMPIEVGVPINRRYFISGENITAGLDIKWDDELE